MKTIRVSWNEAASRSSAVRMGHSAVRMGQASAIFRIDRTMMLNTNRFRVSQRDSRDAMWRVRALVR